MILGKKIFSYNFFFCVCVVFSVSLLFLFFFYRLFHDSSCCCLQVSLVIKVSYFQLYMSKNASLMS